MLAALFDDEVCHFKRHATSAPGAGLEHPSITKLAASRSGSKPINVTVAKRSREYLTDREVERLIEAAKQNRSGHRDATAILVAYRHGLRASELAALR